MFQLFVLLTSAIVLSLCSVPDLLICLLVFRWDSYSSPHIPPPARTHTSTHTYLLTHAHAYARTHARIYKQ